MVHFFVEGPSEDAFLQLFLPRIAPALEFRVKVHQGKGRLPKTRQKPDPTKRGLLDQLPAKLSAYEENSVAAIFVLVDADDDDCRKLASSIKQTVKKAAPWLEHVVRVVVEETESFFLGDQRALAETFEYYDGEAARGWVPDSVCGTWEKLGEVIGDDSGNKRAWAERLAPALSLDPGKNRSPSFKQFIDGVRKIEALAQPKPTRRRKYHHQTKKRR
jgi:hypothetical protein